MFEVKSSSSSVIYGSSYESIRAVGVRASNLASKVSEVFWANIKTLDVLGAHLNLIQALSSFKEVFLGMSPTTVEENIIASAKPIKGWAVLLGLYDSLGSCVEKVQGFFAKVATLLFKNKEEESLTSQVKIAVLYEGLDVLQTLCGVWNKIYSALSFSERTIRVPSLEGFSDVFARSNLQATFAGSGIRLLISAERVGSYFFQTFAEQKATAKEAVVHSFKVVEGTSTAIVAGALLNGVSLRSPVLVGLNAVAAVSKITGFYYGKIA